MAGPYDVVTGVFSQANGIANEQLTQLRTALSRLLTTIETVGSDSGFDPGGLMPGTPPPDTEFDLGEYLDERPNLPKRPPVGLTPPVVSIKNPGMAGAGAVNPALIPAPELPPVPDVRIPYEAEAASIATLETFSDAIIDKLVPIFSGFMSKYFPDDCGYLQKAQQWVCDTLTQGGTGMNPSVEEQIWQRDRARVLTDVRRVSDETLATFASRGFPVPPGAALHLIHQTQVEAQNKIAQASRDVAIKQAEIEIENVRFAVDKAVDLYTRALAAAADYMRALAVGPTSAMQVIPSVTDSQSRLIGAASDYYKARLSASELLVSVATANAENRLKAATAEQDNRTKAAISEYENLVRAAISTAEANSSASVQLQEARARVEAQMYSAEVQAETQLSGQEVELAARVLDNKGRIAVTQLETQSRERIADDQHKTQMAIAKLEAELKRLDARMGAWSEYARSAASVASAAVNALNATASIDGRSSTSTTTTHNYNW